MEDSEKQKPTELTLKSRALAEVKILKEEVSELADLIWLDAHNYLACVQDSPEGALDLEEKLQSIGKRTKKLKPCIKGQNAYRLVSAIRHREKLKTFILLALITAIIMIFIAAAEPNLYFILCFFTLPIGSAAALYLLYLILKCRKIAKEMGIDSDRLRQIEERLEEEDE